jgi:D-lyxose ketol-isomerase
MKKLRFPGLLFFACLVFLFAPKTANADTIIAPISITTDTVWGNANTYVVQATTTVQPGVRLTIDPGTIIKFKTNAKMTIKGNLVTSGLDQNNIVFTSLLIVKVLYPPNDLLSQIICLKSRISG